MDHPWLDFWNKMGETFAIAAAFCFGGAAFLLWITEDVKPKGATTVIIAGQILTAATTAFVHGYLGVSIFVAPIVGLTCGLIAVPVLMAVVKAGNDNMADIIAAGIRRITGQEPKK